MAVTPVEFNYADWALFYTQFASVPKPNVTACFGLAQLYVDNSGGGIVPNDSPALQLQNILYLTTAHIVALNFGIGGQGPSPLVGRITGAAEGSVNVSVDMGAQPMSAAWWNQTPWGAQAWMALAPFRTAIYRPAPRCGPWPRGAVGGRWGGF